MSNSFQSPGICGLLLNPIRSNMFTVVHRIRANLVDAFRAIYIEALLSRRQSVLRSQNIFTIHKIGHLDNDALSLSVALLFNINETYFELI